MGPLSPSQNKTEGLEGVRFLVNKFRQYEESGKALLLNEAQTRNEFIEPLFAYLGWDMRNLHTQDEVVTEYTVSRGRVDLAFNLKGFTQFLLEAKSVKADLEDWQWAVQSINYSWNRAVKWAVLTDFQGLKILNAEIPPTNLANNLFLDLRWDEFESKFDQLWLLSKESMSAGLLDGAAKSWKQSEKRASVTQELFENLTTWRLTLESDLLSLEGLDGQDRDEAIQKLLDRLIFIRAAEDRGIIPRELLDIARDGNPASTFQRLRNLFSRLDKSFNSKLFSKHALEQLPFSHEALSGIIFELYENPDGYVYDFSAISGDLLGAIYERYLSFSQLPESERTDKSKRKLRGIFYTPKRVVDYLLSNTIDELLKEGRDPRSIRVLDPACGSGSFLISAFDRLAEARSQRDDSGLLDMLETAHENIFGIDIDSQAIEIAKLNILLKCLQSDRQLPDLSSNIVAANTLLSQSIFTVGGGFGDDEIEDTPFTLSKAFPEVEAEGGFDLVVGNPPYVFARGKSFSKPMKDHLTANYLVAQYQINTYSIFIERGLQLLRDGGYLAFIVPNTWLTIQTHSSLRILLARETSSLKIVNVFDKVFPDASVDVSLVVCQKGSGSKLEILELRDGEIVKKCDADKDLMESGAPISITALSNPISIGILRKVARKSSPLSEVATVSSGLMAYEVGKGVPAQTKEMMQSRVYHHREKISSSCRPYLEGRDVRRYGLSWGGAWLEYGKNLAAPRKSMIFQGERIIVRQIPSKPPFCIEAAVTDEDFVHDRNSNVITDYKTISGHALVAILNSKVMSAWFVHYFDKMQRKTFPQFKANELASFPIPGLTEDSVALLENAARKLQVLASQLGETPKGFQRFESLQVRIEEVEELIENVLTAHYELTPEEAKYFQDYWLVKTSKT